MKPSFCVTCSRIRLRNDFNPPNSLTVVVDDDDDDDDVLVVN